MNCFERFCVSSVRPARFTPTESKATRSFVRKVNIYPSCAHTRTRTRKRARNTDRRQLWSSGTPSISVSCSPDMRMAVISCVARSLCRTDRMTGGVMSLQPCTSGLYGSSVFTYCRSTIDSGGGAVSASAVLGCALMSAYPTGAARYPAPPETHAKRDATSRWRSVNFFFFGFVLFYFVRRNKGPTPTAITATTRGGFQGGYRGHGAPELLFFLFFFYRMNT